MFMFILCSLFVQSICQEENSILLVLYEKARRKIKVSGSLFHAHRIGKYDIREYVRENGQFLQRKITPTFFDMLQRNMYRP